MIVKFTDLDTLQLALTSGVIPAEVAGKPAVVGFDENQLWVESSAKLPAATQRELKRLGAVVCKSSGNVLRSEVSCWLELLPLLPDEMPLHALEQTPVLFDVRGGEELARLVREMLRLGNDRQSFRWLDDGRAGSRQRPESGRALLRVVGPPYYSLLRAIDQMGGPGVAPHAFVERTPGVWVELGHRHPLMRSIRPPKGKILLLRSPRLWTWVADAPFRDVYEMVEIQLSANATPWQDSPLSTRLRVAPRLRQAGPSDGAEMWVLRGEAIDELNRFVQNAENTLLARLAFAVATKDGQSIVVLRVRQSKLPPPIVVLPAEAYKSYLRIPNLFLPVGRILHPPLRRDVVRKLLADDVERITWLVPVASGGCEPPGGGFAPESLPDGVFRPLTDWVDYVLDRDSEMLQAWVQAMRFEFEPFVCDEEQAAKPKKPPASDKSRGPKAGRPTKPNAGDAGEKTALEASDETAEIVEEEALLDAFAAVEKAEPSELRKELAAVESEFLALPGTLDDDAHQALWPRLADLNDRLENTEDAGICWLNALWEANESADGDAGRWSAAWLRSERRTAARGGHAVATDDLERLLRSEEPATADVRALAAYLTWSARHHPRPTPLMHQLQAVQRFLEKHEKLLPVRACWMAWYHLAQLLDGDVLTLARARDRLLERLFQGGLRAEQDLPNFLRFAGQPAGQRFRDMREWMRELCGQAHAWAEANRDPAQNPPTAPYIDLLFAFGMARLGETDAGKELMKRARQVLAGKDEAHTFLLHSFEYRIHEALAGRAHTGPLSSQLMQQRNAMIPKLRYVVDRLRKHSRILEPEQDIDPYSPWLARSNELEKALADTVELSDRAELQTRMRKLLAEVPRGAAGRDTRIRILRAALEVAPRVSEDFAKEMLDRALPAYDALPSLDSLSEEKKLTALEQQAKFLEKGLFAAAHFGQTDRLYPLAERFHNMLRAQRGPRAIDFVEKTAGQCFRSLRKLGMRDEVDNLLTRMANMVLEGRNLDALVEKINFKEDSPAPLKALLHVASSWCYFGRDHQAEPVLRKVRAVLFQTAYPPLKQTELACAYARAVGQTAMAVAKTRLQEIFRELKGVRDSFTSGSHFNVLQLDAIESVVLAVVSDDFTRGTQARRWLDDDEFLVRRRIHDDHRKMMNKERG